VAERLGILGGTFDPPHVGHLLAAGSAIERLGLDRVVLIPARRQPLKATVAITAAPHRLAMCRALADCDPRLAVDPIELEREGLSFTVDTLREYRRSRPDAEHFLLLGADAAATFGQWREPGVIASLATIVVLTRGGGEGGEDAPPAGPAMTRLATRRVEVSASEVRARVRAGLPIRGLVPDAVAAYIVEHRLYGPTTE
jgi:nicotinate-nucleotide adenylyltransferase